MYQHIKEHKVNQQILIVGKDEKNNEEEALHFSKSLLKEYGPEENKGDLMSVVPEKNLISIDQVREISRFFSMRPLQHEIKIALILAADHLNVQASNALLKTLEEPPSYGYVILTAKSERAVLDTIRSRCWLIFNNKSYDLTEAFDTKDFYRLLRAIYLRDFAYTFQQKDFWDEQRERLLFEMKRFLRDVYIFQMTGEASLMRFSEGKSTKEKESFFDLVRRYQTMSSADLERIMDQIDKMKWSLKNNVNMRLTMETLIVEIMEALYD